MSLLKRIFPRPVAETKPQTATVRASADYVGLVNRIHAGDTDAENELMECFRAGVLQIIFYIVRNPALAEDLSQEALIKILTKIRNGELHEPESLKAFVSSVAKYHAIGNIRRIRQRDLTESLEQAEQIPDPSPNRLEELQKSEEYKEIREVIEELRPRDKEMIWRYYVNEEPKEVICADLGLTSQQFDRILHRARKRYRELYLKRKGRVDKSGDR